MIIFTYAHFLAGENHPYQKKEIILWHKYTQEFLWSGDPEPHKKVALSHITVHEVLLLTSTSGTLDCKTSNSKAPSLGLTHRLVKALFLLLFSKFISSIHCNKSPSNTALQNTPGSYPECSFLRDPSCPLRGLFSQLIRKTPLSLPL